MCTNLAKVDLFICITKEASFTDVTHALNISADI